MATLIGNIIPMVNRLKTKFFPRNRNRARTKETMALIRTVTVVVIIITKMLFFIRFQNVEVVMMLMMLSQCGGLGMV